MSNQTFTDISTPPQSSFSAKFRWLKGAWKPISVVVVPLGCLVAGMVLENTLDIFHPQHVAISNSRPYNYLLDAFPHVDDRTTGELATEIGSLINKERANAGVGPLRRSILLDASANAKLEHLIADDYWAHVAPDGTTPWDFIDRAGYDCKYSGENLEDFLSPKALVDGWMNSPSHRENALSELYVEMGFSVEKVDGGIMAVAHFAQPH